MHDKIGSAQPCITKYWERKLLFQKRGRAPRTTGTPARFAMLSTATTALRCRLENLSWCCATSTFAGSNHTPFGDSYVSFNGGHSKELQERCGEHGECIAYNNEYGIVPPNAYGCRCDQDYGGPLCDVPTYFKNCTDNFCGKECRDNSCAQHCDAEFCGEQCTGANCALRCTKNRPRHRMQRAVVRATVHC